MLMRLRSSERQAALRALCEAYRAPVHRFLVAIARDSQEVEDVTQEFFAATLNPRFFERYHPGKGKFRIWLRECARHVYLNSLKQQRARKRRPRELVDFEGVGEEQLADLAADPTAAVKAFDQQWALTLTKRALDRVHAQYRDRGAEPLFLELCGRLSGENTRTNDAERSKALGRSPEALKTERHRACAALKERFEDCVVDEVVATGMPRPVAEAEIEGLREALVEEVVATGVPRRAAQAEIEELRNALR